jgi:hypothetical protein
MRTTRLAAASLLLGLCVSAPAFSGPLVGTPQVGDQASPLVHLAQRRDGERRFIVRERDRPGRVVVRPGFIPVRPGPVVVTRGWRRPGNYWWRPGGAVAAGAAVGFLGAAAAASWAGAPPAPGYCWYYTDPSYTQGFWDICP